MERERERKREREREREIFSDENLMRIDFRVQRLAMRLIQL